MIEFFKKLFGGGGGTSHAKEEKAVDHNGYHISPCPRKRSGGWSTEAVIRKQMDGELKQHSFIRADASPSREEAISLIISKAKTLIDQQGDKIFSDGSR